MKHPVPDRVKPSFIIVFDICALTLRAERQSARMSKITRWRLITLYNRMLYSCTHMATVDVKVLT